MRIVKIHLIKCIISDKIALRLIVRILYTDQLLLHLENRINLCNEDVLFKFDVF